MRFPMICIAYFLCFASCKTPARVSSTTVPAAPELRVEKAAKNVYENDFDNLSSNLEDKKLVFFGADYLSPSHARVFHSFLSFVEQRRTDNLGVLALEIPSLYQKRIESFLESGDERILLNDKSDPEAEILRGHVGIETKQAMLEIFRIVRGFNAKRNPQSRLRIVALDLHPAAKESYRSWMKHNFASAAYFEWAMQREKHMWNILQPEVKRAQAQKQVVFVFGDAEHSQKSGTWQIVHANGKKILDIKWLASYAYENDPKVTSILLSKIAEECPDKIKVLLKKQSHVTRKIFDLHTSELGNITDFQCSQPFFKGLEVEFMPRNNLAKSLFDFYWFLPQNL